MSISVQLPSFIPTNLAPSTESAKRDSRTREVIPQPQANTAAKSDNRLLSEQNPARNINKDVVVSLSNQESSLSAESEQQNGLVAEVDEQEQKQEGQEKESRGSQKEATESEAQEKQETAEQDKINSLQARHQEVVAHERAHQNAGGRFAGAVSLDYTKGPDGRSYAVSGEVSIDISEVKGDPDATMRKMQQVRQAALAPADPSAQDRMVAAMASSIEQGARVDAQVEAQLKAPDKAGEAEKSPLSSSENEQALTSADEKTPSNVQVDSSRLEVGQQSLNESLQSQLVTKNSSTVGSFANTAYVLPATLYSDSAFSLETSAVGQSNFQIFTVSEQTQKASDVLLHRYSQSLQSAPKTSILFTV